MVCMSENSNNIAYIDGQNLHLGTTKRDPVWQVDLPKFRIFLKEKYGVAKAYYYLGYVQDEEPYRDCMKPFKLLALFLSSANIMTR